MSIDERLSKIESQISAIESILFILSIQNGVDNLKALLKILNAFEHISSKEKDEVEFYNRLSKRIESVQNLIEEKRSNVTA